jgi:spermidine/putrescine ABC transporter ATP-binding subunit
MGQIIGFRGITKRFGDVVALDNINLEVHQGEFLSLLGPSGCGKTTLLRTLAGLEEPTAGRVFIEGRDVTALPAYKRPVNMVFQRWALFPHKTVAENIAFGLMIKKVPATQIAQRVSEMLSLVKLEGYEARYPKQLSGGQAQRVALARALIMQPKVLLLDEPLGSLDLKLRQEMQLELISIHKQLCTTFIYVTHDQEEAMTMSDRIVLMNRGTIIQDAPPREIYQRPNSVFAAQFIGETVLFASKVVYVGPEGCQVQSDQLSIACPPQPALRMGQDVWVSVRPERMRISCAAEPGQENCFQGTLETVIFKGAAVHYQVRVAGGRTIRSSRAWTATHPSSRKGRRSMWPGPRITACCCSNRAAPEGGCRDDLNQ